MYDSVLGIFVQMQIVYIVCDTFNDTQNSQKKIHNSENQLQVNIWSEFNITFNSSSNKNYTLIINMAITSCSKGIHKHRRSKGKDNCNLREKWMQKQI